MIRSADIKAQYDECAKRLLSNKIILAHILKGTVDEFKEMNPEEIIPLIEGEPYISEISVEPGETNVTMTHRGTRIVGNNTENVELEEGKIYFDILFYVRMKDGISQMLINIEAQKSAYPGYHIKNRAIYYISRMISSQKERDFVKSNYNDILKTYSIWICFNLGENCLNHIHMIDTPLIGNHKWDGDDDLLNVILVGLDQKSTKVLKDGTTNDLHNLLGILFSDKLNATEKINLLDQRFEMKETEKIRKELSEMCNLSYGILEEGIKEGIEKGLEKGLEEGMEKGLKEARKSVIREMLIDRQNHELIKKYTGASADEIKEVELELLTR